MILLDGFVKFLFLVLGLLLFLEIMLGVDVGFIVEEEVFVGGNCLLSLLLGVG